MVADGCTVFIAQGSYAEGRQITICRSVIIQGDGVDLAEISGNHAQRVFDIVGGASDVTFDGLGIINGKASAAITGGEVDGGGIRSLTTRNITLQGCALSNNAAPRTSANIRGSGGGIHNGGCLTLVILTVTGNHTLSRCLGK